MDPKHMGQHSKRSKAEANGVGRPYSSPRVLKPFRTVGLVSNGVPCSVTNLGQSYVVSTTVGKSIQIYDAASLRLLFMTQPQAAEEIECIRSYFHHVFAVSGSKLLVYRRGRLEAEAEIPKKEARQRAVKIEVFGGFVCVATPQQVSVFKWSAKPCTLAFHTQLVTPSVLGAVVDMTHMPTYVNKLVVATQSCLVLFNVKTGKLLHTFNEVFQGIAKVEAAPTALDYVAVVAANGDVIIINIRSDRQLFTLTVGEPVTAVSFRSDTGAGSAPLLGLGTAHGDVFFYDLDLRRRIQSLRSFARNHAVSSVQFLPGQPIVIVSGADNTLTELVFDPPVVSAGSKGKTSSVAQRCRVLRKRGGHSLPPSCLVFADEDAHFLLSSSADQNLWAFSLRKDSQSHAFGGTQKVELPPIVAMAYSAEKQDRWDTLLTAHKSSNEARTWNVRRGALGSHKFVTNDGSFCKAVAVSHCGNFAVLGSVKGGITVFNLQSGILRRAYPAVHGSAVTGLALLPNNSALISCSLDGTVKFIDFRASTGRVSATDSAMLADIQLDHGAITDMRFHPGSGLLAVSTDSMALVVIDSATHKVVRELWGHGNRITSFDFSPSGRWLVSGSLDSTIRTWDIPTGACIDGVKIANPVTNLRISPNSEWIATSHVRGVGIQLWALRSATTGLSFRNIGDEDLINIDMPTASGENGVSLLEGALGDFENDANKDSDEQNLVVEVPDTEITQLADGLTTLSGEPSNKFTTLVHFDAIRERNKPQEGLQKPEKAPFFLGIPQEQQNDREVAKRGITSGELSTVDSASASHFSQLLQVGDLEGIASHLTSLGPAATDLEIRSLDTSHPYSEMTAFIDAMTSQARKGLRFELVQAWMTIFLRAHGDIFNEGGSEALAESFQRWQEAQKQSVSKLQEQSRFCSGVLTYIRQL